MSGSPTNRNSAVHPGLPRLHFSAGKPWSYGAELWYSQKLIWAGYVPIWHLTPFLATHESLLLYQPNHGLPRRCQGVKHPRTPVDGRATINPACQHAGRGSITPCKSPANCESFIMGIWDSCANKLDAVSAAEAWRSGQKSMEGGMHITYLYASLKTKVTMLFSLRTLPDHKVDDIGLPVVEVFLDVSGITYDQYEYQLIPWFWLVTSYFFNHFSWLGEPHPQVDRLCTSLGATWVVLTFGKSSNKQGYDHQIRGCDIET